jgi:hypothetical protein
MDRPLNALLELDADERADCAVCTDLLATAPVPGVLALAAAALAAWQWAAAAQPWPSPAAACGAATLGALLLERWLALRVALDARLFSRLASGNRSGLPRLDALDASLQRVLGRPPARPPRSLQARIAGARRLFRLHLAAVALVLLGAAAQAGLA